MAVPRVETTSNGDGPHVVTARGEVDLYVAPALRSAILSALRKGTAVVVDLLDVAFVDSSALGALVAAAKRASPYTPVVVACANEDVVRILYLTGIDRLVPVYPTLEEALAAATPG
jgi:anti-sigma B factor antagonist